MEYAPKGRSVYEGPPISVDEAVNLIVKDIIDHNDVSSLFNSDEIGRESIQSSIQIKKSPSADSGTAQVDVSKEELFDS